MKQYKQRATMDFTVSSGKELGKIQKIIDYANSLGVEVSYKSLKMVCR